MSNSETTKIANSAPPFLLMQDLRFHHKPATAWSLQVAEFSVAIGQVTAVIGPNGSGKSTLLRIAAGVLPPASGTVLLGQVPFGSLDRRSLALRLGYLPQNIAPYFNYTVIEVVRLGRFPHLTGIGLLNHRDHEAVHLAMAQTETADLAERPLSQLSGGERQRVFLASVLAQEPKLLLLDEPTSALDAHHQVAFFHLLKDLARHGMGIAVVTHEINLAALFADQIYLMSQGQIMARGPAAEVITADLLQNAYGPGLLVERHPQAAGKPIILPAITGTLDSTSNGEQS